MSFCKICQAILAIVIIVFAYPGLVEWNNEWVIIVAAVLILFHTLGCRNCCSKSYETMPVKRAAPARKSSKRRKRR